MSSLTRSTVVAAADARAAFSRRQACQGPSKKNGRGPPSSSTAVVTASRNQRSCATRITPASSPSSSRSSHSRLWTSRWFVGSSRSSRSGSPASERASDARVSSPPENESSGRSSSASRNPSPRSTDEARSRQSQPPACSRRAGRVAVTAQRRGVVGSVGHRLLEAAQLLLDRDEIGRAGQCVLAQGQPTTARRALVVERDPRTLGERELAALQRGLADERAQQRRLARSVRAGEREPVAAAQRERDPVEERVAGVLLAEPGCDQHGHRRKGRWGFGRRDWRNLGNERRSANRS